MAPLQTIWLLRLVVLGITTAVVKSLYAVTRNFVLAIARFSCMNFVLPARFWLRKDRTPNSDERDNAISSRAQLFGYRVFWVVLVSGTVFVPLSGIIPENIPARALLLVPIIGMWVLELTRSVAALAMYGRTV